MSALHVPFRQILQQSAFRFTSILGRTQARFSQWDLDPFWGSRRRIDLITVTLENCKSRPRLWYISADYWRPSPFVCVCVCVCVCARVHPLCACAKGGAEKNWAVPEKNRQLNCLKTDEWNVSFTIKISVIFRQLNPCLLFVSLYHHRFFWGKISEQL